MAAQRQLLRLLWPLLAPLEDLRLFQRTRRWSVDHHDREPEFWNILGLWVRPTVLKLLEKVAAPDVALALVPDLSLVSVLRRPRTNSLNRPGFAGGRLV